MLGRWTGRTPSAVEGRRARRCRADYAASLVAGLFGLVMDDV